MPEAIVTNPQLAHLDVSDPLAEYDHGYYQECEPYEAADAITAFTAVALVGPTATTPARVETLDVSDALKAGNLFLGVAQHGAAAGELVSVCTRGITKAKIDTDDPIEGSAVVLGGADGQLGALLIGAQDATIVENTVFGAFLGVEDASDFAWVRLYGR